MIGWTIYCRVPQKSSARKVSHSSTIPTLRLGGFTPSYILHTRAFRTFFFLFLIFRGGGVRSDK